MKTKKTLILTGIIALALAALVFSCNNPVGLGGMLDIEGPEVVFISPSARGSVTTDFVMEGTVEDDTDIDRMLLTVEFGKSQYGKQWRYTRSGGWEVQEAIYEDRGGSGGDNVLTSEGAYADPYNLDTIAGWQEWRALSEAEASPQRIGKSAAWTLKIDMRASVKMSDGKEYRRQPNDGEYIFTLQAWDISNFSNDKSFKTLVLIVDNNPPLIDISNPVLYSRNLFSNGGLINSFESLPGKGADAGELNRLYDASRNNTPAPAPATKYGTVSEDTRKDSTNIGKFLTQDFRIQWQIADSSDIDRIELYFYDEVGSDYYDRVKFDEIPDTGDLPDGFIFRYEQEVLTLGGVRPNGTLTIPALHGAAETIFTVLPDGGKRQLKNPLDYNTPKTIMVYSRCWDAAGQVNDEKILGYFIYWGLAGEPWIEYTDGMAVVPLISSHSIYDGESTDPQDPSDLIDKLFMIYPGRDVKPTAFQAHGVGSIRYTVYRLDAPNDELEVPVDDFINSTDKRPEILLKYPSGVAEANKIVENVQMRNPPRIAGASLSTLFAWNFTPPPQTGFYIVKAQAFGSRNNLVDETNASVVYSALFKVQDISFPIIESIDPQASNPIFMQPSVNGGKFVISGRITDATEIKNIYMVWINPKSRDYAAMSQLSYYRDQNYAGWLQAEAVEVGKSAIENPSVAPSFDSSAPNRVWNIRPVDTGEEDAETKRKIFTFSVEIDLPSEMLIGMNQTLINASKDSEGKPNLIPLSSQIFLLRAENPDKKTHIMTYAPQGDTTAPTIKINRMSVVKTNGVSVPDSQAGVFTLVPKFDSGDRITFHGNWEEDSIRYLNFTDYIRPNFEFTLNGEVLINGVNGVAISYSPATYITKPNATSEVATGTFTLTITLGSRFLGLLTDTVMFGAKVTDIGGNPHEDAASWFVESDKLRFLRISSEEPDRTYRTGEQVEIFLEFNKPVRLRNNVTGNTNWPVLQLGSRANNIAGATATYGKLPEKAAGDPTQNAANTRQYFVYTVGAGQNAMSPNYLNVTGLVFGTSSTDYTTAGYRFTWEHTNNEGVVSERVRLITPQTTQPPNISDNDIIQMLPTSVDNIQSLFKSKQIQIDTTPPTVTGVQVTTGRHRLDAEVFITLTFSENVMINPANIPYLVLSTGSGNTPQTSSRTIEDVNDIAVVRDTIRFKYVVKAGDNTGTSQLTITANGGGITDMAGNSFGSIGTRTLTGAWLDTIAPDAPRIQIVNNSNAQIANGVQTAGGGTWTDFDAAHTNRLEMQNIYNDNVRVLVTVAAGTNVFERDYSRLELSLNNGRDWISSNRLTSTLREFERDLTLNGVYNVTARQVDEAGNVSQWTRPIHLNWDRGNLVSSINSTSANGDYTWNDYRQSDVVRIQVNFRKPLTFTGNQTIELNAVTAAGGTTRVTVLNNTPPAGAVRQLEFVYNVANGHNTNGANLNVTGLTLNATDNETSVATTVTSPSAFLAVPAAANNIGSLKAIKIVTGGLTITPTGQPAFVGGTVAADGTFTATLRVVFNRNIFKRNATGALGDMTIGDIVVTQVASGYRLPAVLTETQRNRFRDIQGFDNYYKRGTNGITSNGNTWTVDTSTKFVLIDSIDTTVASSQPTTVSPTALQTFAEAFRQAEKVTIPVSSSAVTITNVENGTGTLNIALTGSNALQVPGATYDIVIPASIVQDSLDNRSPAPTTTTLTASGIARPFIRVIKPQEIVGTQSVTNDPRLYITNPTAMLQTTARFDGRTPDSAVRYVATTRDVTASGANWSVSTTPAVTTNLPARPGAPSSSSTSTNPASLGDANYQGYIWRVRAAAFVGTNGSAESEEMAFRTVLTYNVIGMNNDAPGQSLTNRRMDNQIWIRGGNQLEVSTIPGFPLTWEDDWNTLRGDRNDGTGGKRAGIRLMRKTATTGNNSNTSTWKWVTWEINVPAYFDIILGMDDGTNDNGTNAANAADIVTQYGPRQWAMQRSGWTSFKAQYRMLPGEHRWLELNGSTNYEQKGTMNFSDTFSARPAMTGANDVTWTP